MTVRLWHVVLLVGVVAATLGAVVTLVAARGRTVTRVQTVRVADRSAARAAAAERAIAAGYVAEQAIRAAEANVRATVPAAEAYFSDHGNYAGMSAVGLRRVYDSEIAPSVRLVGVTAKSYCIESTVRGRTASFRRGTNAGGDVARGSC